jgi:RimJ/RimL family protein N-acetyltransferase
MICPTLETERLILRPMDLTDWEDYAAAWASPEMTAFIGGGPRDRTTSWSKYLAAAGLWPVCGFGYWSFICRETGAFIGNGGLSRFERDIPELDGFPEVGWAITPSGWGKGYATEAVRAALRWSDTVLAAPETRCIIDPANGASFRVADKLGFVRVAEVESSLGPSTLMARVRPRL